MNALDAPLIYRSRKLRFIAINNKYDTTLFGIEIFCIFFTKTYNIIIIDYNMCETAEESRILLFYERNKNISTKNSHLKKLCINTVQCFFLISQAKKEGNKQD